MANNSLLKERNQNFWQLASITGTALGLPAMVIGGQLANLYGAGTALLAVIIGNFILWLIGLSIISMSEDRNQAIENIKRYLGEKTGIFAALIWILSFFIWYIIQIQGVSSALGKVFQAQNNWIMGAAIGIIVSIASIGGIRLIKWACLIGLPLLLAYIVFTTINTNNLTHFSGSWSFSFSAVLSIVLIWLPGTVNLPTFFRHSRSKADSILGLSLVTLFHSIFQAFPIIVKIDNPELFIQKTLESEKLIFIFPVISFVFLSHFFSNLLNIYYASAGWETIFPKHRSAVEYFLVGILGTGAYVFFQISPHFLQITYSMAIIQSILVSFIASLGVVLLIAFVIRLIVKHRPRPLEKFWSSICWFMGCIAAIVAQIKATDTSNDALTAAIITSTLCFLTVILAEDTLWSIKKVKSINRDSDF